ncbi:unnamed protein product [Plasmodium vivax]|uniref:(malaria parasite P. vivax) hypothetical protein n=1 Tax=Plasmodium vivax TaxID=5855 RepID=A0A8S4HGF3_PLAVI|nr:unnamed protein product [Plasmodium vivax]
MVQTEVDDAEVEDTENEIAKMSESGLYKFCSLISPNQLPSENFYGLLTSDINHRKYDGECKKYNGPGKGSRNITRLCSKLVKYVKINPSTISTESHFKNNYCDLLSYWVYEQLNKHFKDDIFNVVKAYNEFQNILDKVSPDHNEFKANECFREYNIFAATDFKERKLLYDYYVDYNTILEKSAETNKCRDYYKYVQSKQRLYDIFEKHCISDGSAQCPEFYKDCKDYNPKEVLDTFICHDDMVRAGVGVYSGRKSGLWGRTVSFLNSSGAARKGSSALLGMVVASVTGGILYKFTPLGKGARNKVGKDKQIRSDINEKPPEVFIYKSDSYNPQNDDAEEHYIGYQPV